MRIIETCHNYQTVFAALHCLDSIISDGHFVDDTEEIPLKLMKELVGMNESSLSFDEYIISMVKAYIRRKTQIVINLVGLSFIGAMIKGFVFEEGIEKLDNIEDDWNPERLSSSRSNLILPDFVSLFPNATSIIIKAGDENYIYQFDMFYFSTSITKASNWESIKIEQMITGKEHHEKSWIKKLWDASKSRLIHQHAKQQLEISFEQHEVSKKLEVLCDFFKITFQRNKCKVQCDFRTECL